MEEWRDVEGYEGTYQVSNEGNGRSLDRIVQMKNRWGTLTEVTKKGKILKKNLYPNGYEFFSFYKNGELKQLLVHRVVAKAFIPNPNNYPEVNHKDECKTNNTVDNLEWCTHQYNNVYNEKHIKIGRQLHNRIDMSKIVYQYKNGILTNTYPSVSEAARQNNIAVSNIIQCCNGGFFLKGKWINKNTVKGCQYSYTKL